MGDPDPELRPGPRVDPDGGDAARRPAGPGLPEPVGLAEGCESFGINVGMLDEAYALAKRYAVATGPNYMYFETGQGAELSADAHHGADQLVMEARCYGLAKRYDPFQVNTVVGFIGPEYLYDSTQIARAGLEDHFMGKLTGLSMGCDVCYTNHARSTQNENENLAVLLGAAGSTSSWASRWATTRCSATRAPAITTRRACGRCCGCDPARVRGVDGGTRPHAGRLAHRPRRRRVLLPGPVTRWPT